MFISTRWRLCTSTLIYFSNFLISLICIFLYFDYFIMLIVIYILNCCIFEEYLFFLRVFFGYILFCSHRAFVCHFLFCHGERVRTAVRVSQSNSADHME